MSGVVGETQGCRDALTRLWFLNKHRETKSVLDVRRRQTELSWTLTCYLTAEVTAVILIRPVAGVWCSIITCC